MWIFKLLHSLDPLYGICKKKRFREYEKRPSRTYFLIMRNVHKSHSHDSSMYKNILILMGIKRRIIGKCIYNNYVNLYIHVNLESGFVWYFLWIVNAYFELSRLDWGFKNEYNLVIKQKEQRKETRNSTDKAYFKILNGFWEKGHSILFKCKLKQYKLSSRPRKLLGKVSISNTLL